jgi:hypothetical protein
MFDQTSRLAERLAASVSRRGFLGSLGGWAAAAALGVSGVLTGAGTAHADTLRAPVANTSLSLRGCRLLRFPFQAQHHARARPLATAGAS